MSAFLNHCIPAAPVEVKCIVLWKIIPRPAPLVDKYRCTHLTLAAREKKIGLKGTKNEKRDCNVLQLQYHSLPAQLLQMKKISFELVFTKLGFEVLILYHRKKKKSPFGNRTADFLLFKNREDKAAQVSNPPKSTPKGTAAHCPQDRAAPLSISNLAWRKHLDRCMPGKPGCPRGKTPTGAQVRSPADIG